MGVAASGAADNAALLTKLQRRHVQRAELARIEAQLPQLARSAPLDYVDAVDAQYCGVGSTRRRERDSVLRGYTAYFGIAEHACPVIHRHTRVLSRMRRTLHAPALTWPDVVNNILQEEQDRDRIRAAMRSRDAALLDTATYQTVQRYLARLARRGGGVVSKRFDAADGKTRLCQVLLPSGELCPNAALLGLDLSRIFFVDCCSVCPAHLKQLGVEAAQLLAQGAMDSYIWSAAVPNTGVWDLRYWIRNKDDVIFYAGLLRKIVAAAQAAWRATPAPAAPAPRRRVQTGA
jgi:hypothetical protein